MEILKNQTLIQVFAYFGAINVFCTIYYMLTTRNIGTPFKDSLTNKQLQILNLSSKRRSKVYLEGLMLGCLLLFALKPFKIII